LLLWLSLLRPHLLPILLTLLLLLTSSALLIPILIYLILRV
jgi:hypothetical protein